MDHFNHNSEKLGVVFGLKDFDDQRYFSRKDLETLKCVDSMNEKIKPLSFLQLLKLKKRKWSYLFIWS